VLCRSYITTRDTTHTGYAVSQRIRKRIEEVFGWGKEIGGMRRTPLRGLERVGWSFTQRVAAYSPIGEAADGCCLLAPTAALAR